METPLETPTPEDLAKQAEENSNNSQDIAATMFTMYLPRYQAIISQLPRKALMRICLALVEYPLNETPFKHKAKGEQEAFNIGHQLASANFMMQLHTYGESLEELKKTEEPVNDEKIEETSEVSSS